MEILISYNNESNHEVAYTFRISASYICDFIMDERADLGWLLKVGLSSELEVWLSAKTEEKEWWSGPGHTGLSGGILDAIPYC